MSKRKKKNNNYVTKAIRTQIVAGATVGIPYRLMGSAPSNASGAVSGMSRAMQPTHTLIGLTPTVQVSKGLLKELKKKR